MGIKHHNPESLHANPAFSQAVTVDGPGTWIQVGGQNAVDASGEIVGDDLRTQSAQALRNVLAALEAVGASQEHVTRLGIYHLGDDIAGAYAAAQEIWGPHATAITVLRVAGLGIPGALVEIEASAFLPAAG
jgi:enamine deaminase RidA (YjgF/YER057c/UK114 family)